jgi:uracil-DNA glycosylase family 4
MSPGIQEDALCELRTLQVEIDACRVCEPFAPGFAKPARMARSAPSRIVVVGIAPGAREVNQEKAFVGPTGKRLQGWLRQAGLDQAAVYGTSLVKCATSKPTGSTLARMWARCGRFFASQMKILIPGIVITLGEQPLRLLFGDRRALRLVVGKAFRETSLAYDLFPLFHAQCAVLPFPHPSPRSTWLRDQHNAELFGRAIVRLVEESSKI